MRAVRFWLWALVLALPACESPNPSASCVDCDLGLDAADEEDAERLGDVAVDLSHADAEDAQADVLDASVEVDAAERVDLDVPDMALDVAVELDVEIDAEIGADMEPDPDIGELDLEVDAATQIDVSVEPDLAVDAEEDAEEDAEPDAEEDAEIIDLCPPGQVAEPERCDGIDNDCDGQVDEGFELGQPCDALGRCGLGFIECDDEGEARCSTAPGGSVDQSMAERCNGRDDDCDGEIDEDPETLAVVCYSGVVETRGVGLCAEGLRLCEDGRLQICAGDTLPRVEVCDGFDNDCDGETDEGYVATELCGRGVCRAASTASSCVGGVELPCAPGPQLGDDQNCDGFDDNCDGQTDEGFVPEEHCGVGRCATEAMPSRCLAGGEIIPCMPGLPSPIDISCDGVDDDCDGEADEDFAITERCGRGICADTSTPSSCVAGVMSPCLPGPPTGDDANCDGRDDDCDGFTDEDYVVVAQCGVGACAEHPTPSRCVGGTEFICQPGVRALDDATCDGRDDDCDGLNDEDYPVVRRCGVGVCAGGATPSSCVAGVETACVPGQPAMAQDNNCNRLDDDCDGDVDEDVPNFTGASLRFTQHQGGAIEPRIAPSGGPNGGYGVAWADNREDARGIYFARLDANGAPVGAQVRVAAQPGVSRKPDIIQWGDQGYAMVWHSTAAGPVQIYFARVDLAGNIVQHPTRLVETVTNATDARVVYNGAEFAVVWTDARHDPSELYLRRLTAAGQPMGEPIRITDVAGAASVPAIAPLAVGQGYLVVYNESVDGDFSVWAQRLRVNGQPLGRRFEISDDLGNSNAPVVVPRAAGGFAAAWYDTRDGNTEIYAAQLTDQGVRGGDLVRVSDDLHASNLVSLTVAGAGFVAAWTDNRTGNSEIWARRLDANLLPFGPEVQVSDDPSTSFVPAVAEGGDGVGVVWYDGRDGVDEVYFRQARLGCAP